MRIRKVHIEGFGCFAKHSFEFGEGLTLIVGPNEAGKTTLVRAILAILFGQQPDDREANVPWGGGAYAGTIELVEGDGTIRIRREFEKELVELTEIAGGESKSWSGPANPRGRGPEIEVYRGHLRRLIGFDDEGLFKSTLCVEQLAIEAEIGQDVRARLTGPSQESAEAIADRLDDDFKEVSNERMTKTAKPRLLQECEQEIAQKTALLDEAQSYFDEVRDFRERGASLEERLGALKKEQQVAEQLFEEIDALADARHDKEQLTREVRELAAAREKISGYRDEQKRLTEEMEAEFKGWDTLPEHYSGMLFEVERRRQEVARSRTEIERLEQEAETARPRASWVGVLAAVVVIGLAFGLGAYLKDIQRFMIGGGAVAAVVLVGFYSALFGRARRYKRLVRARAEAIERYEQNQTSLKALDAQLRPFMASDNPEAEQKRSERYAVLRGKLEGVERAIENSRDPDEVKNAYHDKNAALGRAEAKLKELIESNLVLKRFLDEEDPLRERERLRKEIAERAKTLDERGKELTQVQADSRALTRKPVANESALEDEIMALKRCRAELARRRDALGLAVDVLRETITEYQAAHRESLAGKIGGLYSRLTGGRYDRVRLDEKFGPSLDGLGRQGLTVEQVSRGARDQLYFAMRVAVAEELAGQVRLPFILDDPFVNFDDERVGAVYEVLHELAGRHQFIVLTHNPREQQFVEAHLDLSRA